MNTKISIILTATLLACSVCGAETRWMNPFDCGAETHGQGWKELRHGYCRLPDKAEGVVREPVWNLSRNSAGLSLVFKSNSPEINVRYGVQGNISMHHMPAMGVSGLDLYATDIEGKLRWCAPNFLPSFKDTIKYDYQGLTYYPEGAKEYEYHLYLPLYNTITWLEIGIPENYKIKFYKERKEKPIVVYGTSIAQGACASRPGMAWTNTLERELKRPLVNLGFSGNARLEPELFDLLDEIDASLYILDCMQNNGPKDPVTERMLDGIKKLRKNHDCPILMVEHSSHVNEVTKASASIYRETNKLLHAAYKQLIEEGYKDIYYMTTEETGLGMDGMVEGAHPNDLGMRRVSNAYEKKLNEIFSSVQ